MSMQFTNDQLSTIYIATNNLIHFYKEMLKLAKEKNDYFSYKK